MRRLTAIVLCCLPERSRFRPPPNFPRSLIRLIVPQAVGSATDTVARILGAELGKEKSSARTSSSRTDQAGR